MFRKRFHRIFYVLVKYENHSGLWRPLLFVSMTDFTFYKEDINMHRYPFGLYGLLSSYATIDYLINLTPSPEQVNP